MSVNTTGYTLLKKDKLAINRIHWPVTTLGHGRRIGIWVQGCSIHCPGCCSSDTWESDGSKQIAIPDLLGWLTERVPETPDGITITGGEPFDQPEALATLIPSLRNQYGEETDILVYSGYPWKRLQSRFPHILELIDVVVAEPFKSSRPVAWLRGSNNQEIYALTPLGSSRYKQNRAAQQKKTIQMHYDGQRMWLIGIPHRGDLHRLETLLSESGIGIEDVSWRS